MCRVSIDFYRVSGEVATSIFSEIFECMICHIAMHICCCTHRHPTVVFDVNSVDPGPRDCTYGLHLKE
jgi:hypothetical protein